LENHGEKVAHRGPLSASARSIFVTPGEPRFLSVISYQESPNFSLKQLLFLVARRKASG
jgi:hypothetical protein